MGEKYNKVEIKEMVQNLLDSSTDSLLGNNKKCNFSGCKEIGKSHHTVVGMGGTPSIICFCDYHWHMWNN